MSSVGQNKAIAILGCLIFVFIYSCAGQRNNNLIKAVRNINRLLKSANLGSDMSPTNYLCLFNDEECQAGRSIYCDDTSRPTCRGTCGMSKRLRSFSPYELCVHRDDHRYPRNIVQARCLCGGCYDGTREKHSYVSEAIKVNIDVIRLNWTTNVNECRHRNQCSVEPIELQVGCHCTIPVMSQH